MMMKIDPGIENERIAKGESLDIARELLAFWHRGVVDQHRNDGDAAFDGGFDFIPDEVSAVVKATRTPARDSLQCGPITTTSALACSSVRVMCSRKSTP
jgi:hypothetical protein